MASNFQTLTAIGANRNPVQETEYRNLLKQQGMEFKIIPTSNFHGGYAVPLSSTEVTEQKRSALNTQMKGEESEFLSRFKTEFPQVLTGIEEELGLPGLRKTAFDTGELLRTAPQRQKQASQGFDVSQNQLERIVAEDVGKLAP